MPATLTSLSHLLSHASSGAHDRTVPCPLILSASPASSKPQPCAHCHPSIFGKQSLQASPTRVFIFPTKPPLQASILLTKLPVQGSTMPFSQQPISTSDCSSLASSPSLVHLPYDFDQHPISTCLSYAFPLPLPSLHRSLSAASSLPSPPNPALPTSQRPLPSCFPPDALSPSLPISSDPSSSSALHHLL